MAPDINPQDVQQNPKYPSNEQIAYLCAGMFNAAGGIYATSVEEFVRAICDWQREQDALICESIGTLPVTEHYSEGMRDMQRQAADAIRAGASHD